MSTEQVKTSEVKPDENGTQREVENPTVSSDHEEGSAGVGAQTETTVTATHSEGDDSPKTLLLIRGVPFTASLDQIRAFFANFTLSEEGQPITFFARGVGRGIAYVRLQNVDEIPKAIEQLNWKGMGDRYIEVRAATESQLNKAITANEEAENAVKYTVVRLRGLPFTANEEDIREFLTTVPNIHSIQVCHDVKGCNTGDAFVELESNADLDAILALHMGSMGSRYIEVMHSSPQDRESIVNAVSHRPRGRARRNNDVPPPRSQQGNAPFSRGNYFPGDFNDGGAPPYPAYPMPPQGGYDGTNDVAAAAAAAASAGFMPPHMMAMMQGAPGMMNQFGGFASPYGPGGRSAGGASQEGSHGMPPETGKYVVRLKGLLPTAGEQNVREFLATVNNIIRIDICRGIDGRGTGEAFVEVETEADLQQIRTLHRTRIGTRPIGVLGSSPRERYAVLCSTPQYAQGGGAGMAGFNPMDVAQMYRMYMAEMESMLQSTMSSAQGQYGRGYGGRGGGSRGGYRNNNNNNNYNGNRNNNNNQNRNAYPYDPQFQSALASYMSMLQGPYLGMMNAGRYPPTFNPALMQGAPFMGAGMPPQPPMRELSKYVVRIRGLPFNATEENIAEFFSSVSIPPQGVHKVYQDQDRPNGEAFVEVSTAKDVELALERNGSAMSNRYIEVFNSTPAEMKRLQNETEQSYGEDDGSSATESMMFGAPPGFPMYPPYGAYPGNAGPNGH